MSTETMTKVPVHVSLIMDGNGRWAKERGKERVYGHFEGVESVRACVEAAVETGGEVSLSLCVLRGKLEPSGLGSADAYGLDGQGYG